MSPKELAARVVRRFKSAVLLRDVKDDDDTIMRCTPGCMLRSDEVVGLLHAQDVDAASVTFTSDPWPNMITFIARLGDGSVANGAVTFKCKYAADKVMVYAEVELRESDDEDEGRDDDGEPEAMPAPAVIGTILVEVRDLAARLNESPTMEQPKLPSASTGSSGSPTTSGGDGAGYSITCPREES